MTVCQVICQIGNLSGFITASLDPHSFLSRARNALNIFVNSYYYDVMQDSVRDIFVQRYGSDFPTFAVRPRLGSREDTVLFSP